MLVASQLMEKNSLFDKNQLVCWCWFWPVIPIDNFGSWVDSIYLLVVFAYVEREWFKFCNLPTPPVSFCGMFKGHRADLLLFSLRLKWRKKQCWWLANWWKKFTFLIRINWSVDVDFDQWFREFCIDSLASVGQSYAWRIHNQVADGLLWCVLVCAQDWKPLTTHPK